nr:hypothetical protein [Pedobacter panaciterrae]
MNNIKKAVLAVLIAGMAFGFSAFTTIKSSSIVVYYKADMMNPLPTDPSGYRYYSGDRCEPLGNLCSAQWQIGSNPIPTTDGTPLPASGRTLVTGSIIAGHFE